MSFRARADVFARSLEDGTADDPTLDALADARAELTRELVPSDEFRARLRRELLAAAGAPERVDAPLPEPVELASRRRWVRPLLAACASLVLLVAALAGISLASRDALPGDTLYGAKRATESLELRTKDGDLDKGIARLHLAEKRLAEVRALADAQGGEALGSFGSGDVLAAGSNAALIRSTLAAMDDQTRTGSGLVLAVAKATDDPDPVLGVLAAWSEQQAANVAAVRQEIPAAAETRLETSLTLIRTLNTDTNNLIEAN